MTRPDQRGLRIEVEREIARPFAEQGMPPVMAQRVEVRRLEAASSR
jgi:hypothetical protein